MISDKQIRISDEDYRKVKETSKEQHRTIKAVISLAINFFIKKGVKNAR